MNNRPQFIVVYTANGKLDAEMKKAFLESEGIKAMISQESAGSTLGLTMGPLGEVQILVPEHEEMHARQLLDDLQKGKFELNSNDFLDDFLEEDD